MIPGINDMQAELREIADIVTNVVKRPAKVNLLPYHKFGIGKYQMLDREYELEELETQSDEEIKAHKVLFESLGFECEIEG